MFEVGRCLLPQILKELGWSHQDLADRTGFTRSQIGDWCSNRHPMSIRSLKTVSEAVGRPMEAIYEWVPVKKKSRQSKE